MIIKIHDEVKEDNYRALCRQLEAHGFTDWELQEDLRAGMEAGKQTVELHTPMGGFRVYDDQFNYMLIVNRHGDYYTWKETVAGLHRNLLIRHDNIDGVDTAELERRMRPINWQLDYHDLGNNDVKGVDEVLLVLSRVRDILYDLVKLQQSENERGTEISIQLIQRYLLRGPNGRRYHLQDYLFDLNPPITQTFDMEARPFSFREIYNLMCGRAVRKRVVDLVTGAGYRWYRLAIDYRSVGDSHTILEYPDFNCVPQLQKLCCPELEGHQLHIAGKLLHAGDPLHLTSPHGPVVLSIDPARRLVIGLSEYLEVIEPAQLLRMFEPVEPTLEVAKEQRMPGQSLARRLISRLQRGNPFAKRKTPGR